MRKSSSTLALSRTMIREATLVSNMDLDPSRTLRRLCSTDYEGSENVHALSSRADVGSGTKEASTSTASAYA